MAIDKIKETEEFLEVRINNGDFKVLKEITESWKFKDCESALRFGLAVLKLSKLGTLLIEQNGTIQPFGPGEVLLKNEEKLVGKSNG